MTERLPWFRCRPGALLGAISGMSPEAGYIYTVLLLRIYEQGGPVAETGETLARRTGFTKKRATAALEWLIEAGRVRIERDGRLDSDSTHAELAHQVERREKAARSGRYSAEKRVFAKYENQEIAGSKFERQKTQQNQQNEATDVQLRARAIEIEIEREKKEAPPLSSIVSNKLETHTKTAFGGGFEEFWISYPHKVGKDVARRKFETIRKSGRVCFSDLMAGLEAYKAGKPHDRPWCNPSTWLNQGRWQDQPAEGAMNGNRHSAFI